MLSIDTHVETMDLAAVMNSFLEGLQKGDGGAIGIAVAIVVVILSICEYVFSNQVLIHSFNLTLC